MKIKTLSLLGFSSMVFLILLLGFLHIRTLQYTVEPLTYIFMDDFHLEFDRVVLQSSLRDFRYYDEVLTQSARNFAFTGDDYWKTRYDENSLLLDALIQDIKQKHLADMEQLEQHNQKLLLMEMEVFDSKDNLPKALLILESEEYLAQKKAYTDTIQPLLDDMAYSSEKRYADFALLEANTKNAINRHFSELAVQTMVIMLLCIGLLSGLCLLLLKRVINPIVELTSTITAISKGQLDVQIKFVNQDTEIGDLAKAFDRTLVSLKLAMRYFSKNGDKNEKNSDARSS